MTPVARHPGAGRPAARTGAAIVPSLRAERALLRDGYALVAGMDEVGRGALAGPVSVGVVVVRESTRSAPQGLRDSKLLTPAARAALVPRLRRWAPWWAVGHAQPAEIDAIGIIAALRLAGRRALAQLPVQPSVVLLDGSHDWLTPPAPDLLDLLGDQGPEQPEPALGVLDGTAQDVPLPAAPALVRTMVKADLRCAAVAAASVLAKTERDAMMVERSAQHPAYLWADNKGYAAPEHLAALERLGPCAEHRRSWRLPGCGGDPATAPVPAPRTDQGGTMGAARGSQDGLDGVVAGGTEPAPGPEPATGTGPAETSEHAEMSAGR